MRAQRVVQAQAQAKDAAMAAFARTVRPRLIAESGHVVFRLDPFPIVARVGLTNEGIKPGDEICALRLARALEPVSSVPLPDSPTVTRGAVVTFHPLIEGRHPGPSIADTELTIGALKKLHKKLIPHTRSLRVFTHEIEQLRCATSCAGDGAAAWMKKIDADVQLLSHDSTHLIPVHGDANPGNLVITPWTEAFWIDFECACLAPIEWDVALLPNAAAKSFNVDVGKLELCRTLRDHMYRAWSLVHPVRKPRADNSVDVDARTRKALQPTLA